MFSNRDRNYGSWWLLLDHVHDRVIGDMIGCVHRSPYWDDQEPSDFDGVSFAYDPNDEEDELGGWMFEGEWYDYFDLEVICVGRELYNGGFFHECVERYLAADGSIFDLGEYGGGTMYVMAWEGAAYLLAPDLDIATSIGDNISTLKEAVAEARHHVEFWTRYAGRDTKALAETFLRRTETL